MSQSPVIVVNIDRCSAKMRAAIESLRIFYRHTAYAMAVARETVEDLARALADHYCDPADFDFPIALNDCDIADLHIFPNILHKSGARRNNLGPKRDNNNLNSGGRYPRYPVGFV